MRIPFHGERKENTSAKIAKPVHHPSNIFPTAGKHLEKSPIGETKKNVVRSPTLPQIILIVR